MSEQQQEQTRKVLDTDTVLADLAAWWDAWEPLDRGYPRRIAGGEWDQQIPEGTQNPYWEIIRQLPLGDMSLPWHQRPEPMLHWMGGDYLRRPIRCRCCRGPADR